MLKDSELIGKYIRYSPEISEEIFDKIVKRLKDINVRPYGYRCTFGGFKEFGSLEFGEDYYQTVIDSNYTEISYKDIIGEDEWWKDLRKGDYIVVVKEHSGLNGKLNYIYRADKDVYKYDRNGEYRFDYETGMGSCISLTDVAIRKPSPEEIAMYIHAGNKPVDVTTYKIPEEKSKLEIGKWYGRNRYPNTIIKFKEIGNDGVIHSSEEIWNLTYNVRYGSWGTNVEDFKPVNISDFQQYLPESHVDKIKSFTVHDKCNIGDIIVSFEPDYVTSRKNGDLYKVLKGSNSNSLNYNNGCAISKKNSDTYRLATPQEVEMYNKGIKNIYDVKEEEFKVGDWVKLVSMRPQHYNAEGKMDYLLGKVVQLTQPTIYTGSNNIEFKEIGGWAVSKNDIERKATPEEIYKAGGYPEQKEFVLPEKWCIRGINTPNPDNEILLKYFRKYNSAWNITTESALYYIEDGGVRRSYEMPDNYTEITLEQFRKYVLEEEVQEKAPKKDSMEEILLEAKRRFPVGCKFRCLKTHNVITVTDDWDLQNNQIINNKGVIVTW